jgi:hypothetical protein
MLTFYPARSRDLGRAVRDRLALEHSKTVRAGLLLCLGYWARWNRSQRDVGTIRGYLADDSAIVRASAAIALAACGAADAVANAELVRTLHVSADRRLPWLNGRLAEMATAFLVDGSAQATASIAISIASPDLDDDSRITRAAILTRSVFPSEEQGRVEIVDRDMPMPSELTGPQRTALDVLAALSENLFDRARVDSVLRRSGLPGRHADVQRYIGRVAPGPMDRIIAGRVARHVVEWPAHRWYRRVALGSVARADALDAFSRYPSDDELLDTLLEGAAAYDLSITRNLGWPEAARLAIDALARRGKRSRVAIEHRLDNLRPGSENAYSTWILLGALARMGFELPGRYDEWVSKMKQSRVRMNDVLDTVVQAMPPARRALL